MPTRTVKLIVITDMYGKVQGTMQFPDYEAAAARAQTNPGLLLGFREAIAGPDQERHDVDVELPERLFQTMDIDELHRIVQVRINEVRPARP